MRNGLILAVALIVASMAFAQSIPSASPTSYMVVTDVKTSPSDIYAGDDVNMSFLVYNTYSYTAEGVIVQLTGGYPLLEVSPSQSIRINNIPSGINQIGLEPLNFMIHVDPNAPAGTYTLNVLVTYSTVTETKLANGATSTLAAVRADSVPISLRVRGAPHLSANIISQGVEPGVNSVVTFSIINDGTDTAKSASITLNSTGVFDVLGTSSTNLGDIEPGKSVQASFSIRAKESASSERHDLPVNLDYMNKYGTDFQYSAGVPILVSVYEPALEVSVSDTTNRPRAGDDASILLTVRNRGDGIAKNVRLEVSSAGPIEVKWPTDNITLGDIPGGASVTATLKVKVQDGANDQDVNLPGMLIYTNSNKQKQYEVSAVVDVGLEKSANFVVSNSSGVLHQNDLWKQVDFTIKNTGNVPAKEIKVTLNTQYPITPSGKDEYIPLLAPGEEVVVSFHVDIDSKAVPQTYPVDLYFQWKEDGDALHTSTKSYSLSVANGGSDNTTYYLVGGVAVLLVAGYFIRKKMKGKKK